MSRSVIFVALLVVAVAMVVLAARIFFSRWSTYLPPTARRAAFAIQAASAMVFAVGLVVDALGLQDQDLHLGFVGSVVVLAAIALSVASRYSARSTD